MFKRDAAAALGLASDLGDKDLKILLKHLARDRQVVAYDEYVSTAKLLLGIEDNLCRLSRSRALTRLSCRSRKKTDQLRP